MLQNSELCRTVGALASAHHLLREIETGPITCRWCLRRLPDAFHQTIALLGCCLVAAFGKVHQSATVRPSRTDPVSLALIQSRFSRPSTAGQMTFRFTPYERGRTPSPLPTQTCILIAKNGSIPQLSLYHRSLSIGPKFPGPGSPTA